MSTNQGDKLVITTSLEAPDAIQFSRICAAFPGSHAEISRAIIRSVLAIHLPRQLPATGANPDDYFAYLHTEMRELCHRIEATSLRVRAASSYAKTHIDLMRSLTTSPRRSDG